MSTRSEPATPRKLGRARSVGDVPRFLPFSQALVLGATALLVPAWLNAFGESIKDRLKWSLLNHDGALSTLRPAIDASLRAVLVYSVPILAVATAAGIAARMIESRAAGAASTATSMSNPRFALRLKNLVSLDNVLGTIAAWVLAAILATGALSWFRHNVAAIVGTLGSVHTGVKLATTMTMQGLVYCSVCWLLVGALGYSLAHRLWLWQKRMSQHEKQLEQKEAHGDPAILRARRQQLTDAAAEASLRSELAAMIVLESGKRAALLHYDGLNSAAPRLLRIARGSSLSEVLMQARHHEIPIVEDPHLATELAKGVPGAAISEDLFEAVAAWLVIVLANRDSGGGH